MSESQPTYVACDGGLVLDTAQYNLFGTPGVATKLVNYEVDIGGGYRRINGYKKFGEASATRPTGAADPILGVHPYALGVVAVAGEAIYYSEDGITWTQVNKNTGSSGMAVGPLAGAAELPRTNQGTTTFALMMGEEDHADNPYGVLYIASEGGAAVGRFYITGTGGSRTFTYSELTTPAAGSIVAGFDGHLCVVDGTNEPNTLYWSDYNDHNDFTGALSGSKVFSDNIVGLKGFRGSLIIFCERSIYRLVDINDPASVRTEPITTNLGCIAGGTVQEIGGDVIFLSSDGFRTVAGTDRIGDTELSSVSKRIQPLVSSIIPSQYSFCSTVLKEKSQYRVFYINDSGVGQGITGTVRLDQYGNIGFQWTELRDISVNCINTHTDATANEITYHGSFEGYVYLHDTGNTFDGTNITSIYRTPDMHLGDLGLRKTLHYANVAIYNRGAVTFSLIPKFDFSSSYVMQPSIITLALTSGAGGVLGTSDIGEFVFGSGGNPLTRVPLQGSCSSVSFTFTTTDASEPFTIQGLQIEQFPSGRK